MDKFNTKGRCLDITVINNATELTVLNQNGIHKKTIKKNFDVKPGDICGIDLDGNAIALTKNRKFKNEFQWTQNILLNTKKTSNLKIRQCVEQSIRSYFNENDFLEVRTPLLVHSPGMEPHICPIQIKSDLNQSGQNIFLPTSPEFAMKKLLVGGLEKIYQIGPCFRSEPQSITHLPEFIMLEWYRSYANYNDIMLDTELFISKIAEELYGKPIIKYQGQEIDLTPPWPRLKIRDLFKSKCGIDLLIATDLKSLMQQCLDTNIDKKIPHFKTSENFDDLYFKIWLNLIEPQLPKNQPVFVCDYPASQAALSNITEDKDGFLYAKRFEVYIAGLELANAFDELTDPVEQHKRFIEDQKVRKNLYSDKYPKSPIDQEFIDALTEGLPPSSGCALGVDRLVMLFCDEKNIENTFWLKPHY